MEYGATLIAILHLFVAFLLVTIVLLQDSKGGGVGGAFGGGSSQTLFGATGGASFLVKLTRGLAITFMITCILLASPLFRKSTRSVVDSMPAAAAPAAPAQPQTQPAPGQPAPSEAPANK